MIVFRTVWRSYRYNTITSIKYVAQRSCATYSPNGHTTSQSDLTAYTATALHHTWKNTTKSSAPEDGHKVARNMLSNL